MSETLASKAAEEVHTEWVQFNEEDNKNNVKSDYSPTATMEKSANESIEKYNEPPPPINVEKQKTTNWVQFDGESSSTSEPSKNDKKDLNLNLTGNNLSPENYTSSLQTSPEILSSNRKTIVDHPLNNVNSSHVDADSIAVDMSVTCTQHSVADSRQPLDRQTNRQRNSAITQGFSNGDCIVSVLPLNNKCAWLTKAEFKPELVPEELMAQGLTLTVEDYVQALRILVSDFRFNMFIICYKRILIAWILIGFIFLISFLFSGLRGIVLFVCGIVWLILNAFGIFFCMWFKIKLNRGLEYCMAEVNSFLFKQKVILALDDRGKLSCHKVNLIFLYFDVTDCLKYLNELLNKEDRLKGVQQDSTRRELDLSRMDIDENGIVIVGSSNTVLSQHQKRAEKLLLRYMQRWAKEFVRKRLDLNVELYSDGSGSEYQPVPARHCATARCLCQFIEEYLSYKPAGKCSCFKLFAI